MEKERLQETEEEHVQREREGRGWPIGLVGSRGERGHDGERSEGFVRPPPREDKWLESTERPFPATGAPWLSSGCGASWGTAAQESPSTVPTSQPNWATAGLPSGSAQRRQAGCREAGSGLMCEGRF